MTTLDDNKVATALVTKLNASVALMALITKVYRDDIPEGATLDYVRFFLVSQASRDTFSQRYWPLKYQFDIYSKGEAGVATLSWRAAEIKKELTAALDNAVLTIDDYNSVYCKFDFASGDLSWEEGVKRIIVQYSILVGEG